MGLPKKNVVIMFISLALFFIPSIVIASQIAIPPIRSDMQYKLLMLGLQQVVIDNLNDITSDNIIKREDIRQYLERNLPHTPQKGVFTKDALKITEDLKVNYVILCNLKAKNGNLDLNIKIVAADQQKVTSTYDIKANISEFYVLKNKLIEFIVSQKILKFTIPVQTFLEHEEKVDIDTLIQFSKGLLYFDQNQDLKSIEYLKSVYEKNPSFTSGQKHYEIVKNKLLSKTQKPDDLGNLKRIIGEKQEAKQDLMNSMGSNPNSVQALVGMGKINLEENNVKEAKLNFEQALKLDKTNTDAMINLGKTYKMDGDYNQSMNMLNKASALEPNNIEVHENLADLYQKTNKESLAAKEYMNAAELSANELSVNTATTYLNKAKNASPKDSSPLILESDIQAMTGNPTEALKTLKSAQTLSKNNDQIYQKMGDISEELNDNDNAKQMYSKSIELNESNMDATIGMASVLKKEGKTSNAKNLYQKALEINSKSKEANAGLAKLMAEEFDVDGSIKHYEYMESLDPDDSDVQKEKGKVLLKKGDLEQAKECFEKAHELNPDDSEVLKELGITQTQLGLTKEAEKTFENAKNIDPSINLSDISKTSTLSDTLKIKGEQQEVANKKIAKLITSFPNIGSTNAMAIIEIGKHVEKPDFSAYWKDYVRFFPLIHTKIRTDIYSALTQRFEVLKASSVDSYFSLNKKFVQLKEMVDPAYMDYLCNELGVSALMFYKVIHEPKTEKDGSYSTISDFLHPQFKILTIMYPKSQANILQNSTYVSYNLTDISIFMYVVYCIITLIVIWFIKYFIIDGSGTVYVEIIQDPNKHAIFSLTLSKNKNLNLTKTKQNLLDEEEGLKSKKKYSKKAKKYKKFERYLVKKDSQFNNIHIGKYQIYLFGIIEESLQGKEIGNYQIQQEIFVEKKKTTNVTFDLCPKECFVEFNIFDKQNNRVSGAEIHIKGILGSKFSKADGMVYFYLPFGETEITAEYEGKKITQEISIEPRSSQVCNIYLG